MSSNQPTNYGDFRDSVELALDAEDSNAKKEVLETLDDVVANNADRLHFPGDESATTNQRLTAGDGPYNALIVHEDGSGIDEGIVDHYHHGEALIVEYIDGSGNTYALGDVEEIDPKQ